MSFSFDKNAAFYVLFNNGVISSSSYTSEDSAITAYDGISTNLWYVYYDNSAGFTSNSYTTLALA